MANQEREVSKLCSISTLSTISVRSASIKYPVADILYIVSTLLLYNEYNILVRLFKDTMDSGEVVISLR